MKNIQTHACFPRAILLCAVFALLTACATPGLSKEKYVGVAVEALNYSAREVSYIAAEDAKDPKNRGGGDALNPYSGGGTICCFGIPAKWRPDLQVIVEYQIYPEEEYRRALVNVPPYANNEADDIWLIIHADESAEAVISRYRPGHEKWPGKIRDYPVPSKEYQLKIWERNLKRAQKRLDMYQKGLLEPGITKETKEMYQKNIGFYNEDIRNLEAHKP